MTALENAIAEIARAIAREVVAELQRGEAPGLIDQTASVLGRRRHVALARELLAAGSSDAAKIGRRYLVRREAVEARAIELSRRTPRKAASAASEPSTALLESLGLKVAS